MTIAEVSYLPSIQGEKARPVGIDMASEADVDQYVNEHSEAMVQCRMERRHAFPAPRNGMVFTDVDRNGNFVAEYVCARCDAAIRHEVWAAVQRGRSVRYQLLEATVRYRTSAQGESYLMPPGAGRMRPSTVRESVMTGVMQGISPAQMRKELSRAKAG